MSDHLEDEITSVNAIYTEDTLTVLSAYPKSCSLLLPGEHHISLRLEFPGDYPDTPPSILGTQSVGETLPKGLGPVLVELSRNVLSEVYVPGSPCIYDLVEEISTRLQELVAAATENKTAEPGHSEQAAQVNGQSSDQTLTGIDSDPNQPVPLLDKEPPWVLSEVVTEKKSIFVARAARVTSPDQAKSYLHHLLATDKKVAKATHNITAWRIHGPAETAFQDCDDDGETAAGGRLLHLLQLMDVWDVMVIVTRWYGGVQLGPDRFRIINSTARDAVVKGGFVKEGPKSKGEGKKSGKK